MQTVLLILLDQGSLTIHAIFLRRASSEARIKIVRFNEAGKSSNQKLAKRHASCGIEDLRLVSILFHSVNPEGKQGWNQ